MQRLARTASGPEEHGNYFRGQDLRYLNGLAAHLPFPREAVLRFLPRGARLVDGGCGPGRWVRYFAARGYRITGYEQDAALVRRARKLWPGLAVRQGDITDLPLRSGSVDGYLSGGVVEHYEDPRLVLREARRVLRRGGYLFIDVPAVNGLRAHLPPADSGGPLLEYRYAAQELADLLATSGFQVVGEPVPVDSDHPDLFVGLYCDFPYMRGRKLFTLRREYLGFARALRAADPWLACYGVGCVARKR